MKDWHRGNAPLFYHQTIREVQALLLRLLDRAILSPGEGHLEPGMRVITKPFPVDGLPTKIRAIIEDDPPGM